jgi:predicted kinase
VAIDIHSPDHWRRRATEMRELADETKRRSAKLLELAADYDRMAKRAEERAGGPARPTWDLSDQASARQAPT